MEKQAFKDLLDDLHGKMLVMSLKQLNDLNKLVVILAKTKREQLTRNTIATLEIGMRVSWKTRDGHTKFGEIYKINRKTVYVYEEGSFDFPCRWKINASLLTIA